METVLNNFHHSIPVLVLDDEVNNQQVLSCLLEAEFPGRFQIHFAANVQDAISVIGTISPQILFLDIRLRNETGFDLLLQKPDLNAQVIFVTAHDQFAVKAFRFNAADYLLKPILAYELRQAVEKVLKTILQSPSANRRETHVFTSDQKSKKDSPLFVSIASADRFTVVATRDIVYCRASSNYTTLFITDGQKLISSQTLGYYETLLTGSGFIRVHRSYLIQLSHVKSYKKGDSGGIIMSNGDEVELARQHRALFFELFEQ